ncbi:MAG: hypothetical protein WCQ99_00825 [Pseudomonadota bacterium]
MSDHFCDRCGEYLPEGTMKYTVHLQIISDFDGVILFDGDGIDEAARQIFSSPEGIDEKELEEEVYQELCFTLCGTCKKRFAKDPFSRGSRLFRTSKNFERLFH